MNNKKENKKTHDQDIKIYFPFGEHPDPQKEVVYSNWEPVYKYDAKLNNIVLTDEMRNTQEEINAYLDGTRIYDILDKYAGINSDNFATIPELNKKSGMYVDISDLPTNIHDLQKISIAANEKLKELENAYNPQDLTKNNINENSENIGENQNQKINKENSNDSGQIIKEDK